VKKVVFYREITVDTAGPKPHLCKNQTMIPDNTNLMSTERAKLTRRELEVLYWVSQGKPAKEIATNLYISTATVQKHLKNSYRKLDVHNRIEAIQKTRWLTATLFSNQN
jgi:DNA-binding CsgD family transcriptional regulator